MRISRVKPLADAVAASFQAAGLAPADLLQGQIEITDLVWQVPPIRCQSLLRGFPLYHYLDFYIPVEEKGLYDFFTNTILSLRHDSQDLFEDMSYKGVPSFTRGEKQGNRDLYLPKFYEWPVGDEMTGPMFALECAHLLSTSCALADFIENDDSYCAVTSYGKVGIEDGHVTYGREIWDISCKGVVLSLLEQPRGYASNLCLYDVLARLRSALHSDPDRFGSAFEGVDYGLQAIRVMSGKQTCLELVSAIEGIPQVAFKRQLQMTALRQAIRVMDDWHMSDRAKVSCLLNLLVPDVFRPDIFNKRVINVEKILPAVLPTKTENRIRNYLKYRLSELEIADQSLKPIGSKPEHR